GGRVWSGAAAAARLARTRWWSWPLGALYALPVIQQLADQAYSLMARNRYRLAGRTCDSGACNIHH
ncbi:MAG: DUF393 domain-containing protein, partial [Phycisphaerales bacterium]|nr:DUF393 domain-containing protein [Phycisphaerales bacterium]